MSRKTSSTKDKRARLTDAAARVVYRQGFAQTSLADIAKDAKIPVGNVYYYFKTKDEIGVAIIEQREQEFRAAISEFDQLESPKERLSAFVNMTASMKNEMARRGCPIGSLCSELGKNAGALARKMGSFFGETLVWMESQFKAIGMKTESRGLAIHLLSALQGVAVVAQALGDPEAAVTEVNRLVKWIRSL